jgi:hypothetical protein
MTGSIPTLAAGLRVAIIGELQGQISQDLNLVPAELENADAAIFQVSTKTGVLESSKLLWEKARELYIPSLVLITDFDSGEIDFDDMSLIVGRILDPLVTPYLVLHADAGDPIALIELENLKLFDYTNHRREIKPSENEHKELVTEFRTEFLDNIEEFGPTGFQDALIFPAIPYLPKIKMGIIETLEYLAQLPTRS